MKMDREIRVQSDKSHREFYRDYRKHLGKDAHELFYLAVCIGFHQKQHCPRTKNSAEERFWSRTILPEEWATYYAIMLHKNDMNYDAICDDAETLQMMEAYANGGINYLIEEELVGGFLIEKDGLTMFDSQLANDIPRRILQFMFHSIEWNE